MLLFIYLVYSNKAPLQTSALLIQLIDLKAELFRKQEEFKKQKLLSQNTSFIKGKGSGAEKKVGHSQILPIWACSKIMKLFTLWHPMHTFA